LDGVIGDRVIQPYACGNWNAKVFSGSLYVKGEGANIGKTFGLQLKRVTGTLVYASQTITLTADWQRVTTGSITGIADSVDLYYIIRSIAGGATSMLAWGGMINAGPYALTYELTTDNQTLTDRGPYGYNGQLGSTAGADVNDPVWGAIGLTYGADDFVKIAAAANINDLAQITIMSALRLDGWGGGGTGRISDKGGKRNLYTTEAYLGFLQDFDGATDGSWASAAGSLSLAGQTVAVAYDRTSAANTPTFFVNGLQSATTQVTAPAGSAVSDAASDLYLGNAAAANRNLDGPQGYYLEYNRILTPAEIMRNHHVLRGAMARRGLVI
jgi:hypothetical protein